MIPAPRPMGASIGMACLVLPCLWWTAVAASDQGQRPGPQPGPPIFGEASERSSTSNELRRSDIESRAKAAVDRSLLSLQRAQSAALDGSFSTSGAEHAVPVPVAALGALAYMAAGTLPDRGPQGAELSRAIDYLVSRCDLAPGSATRGYISSDGDAISRMHGHGLATLALSQVYVSSPTTARGAKLAAALEAAVRLIESSQGSEGGWFYYPRPSYEHENSVSVCLVQALRGAHGAGIKVDTAVVSRAVDYIKRCQTEDGSFRYALNQNSTSAALTAAGVATLNSIGVYDGPVIERAMEYLARDLAGRENETGIGDARSLHYERFYVAQALWQAPDARLWETWRSRMVAQLESEQLPDGSWRDSKYGDAYATAMHSLVLSIPLGYLPIFQR